MMRGQLHSQIKYMEVRKMVQENGIAHVNPNIQGNYRPATGPANPISTAFHSNNNEGKEERYTKYTYVGHSNYRPIGVMLTPKDQVAVRVCVEEHQPGLPGVMRGGHGMGATREEAAASAVMAAATLGQLVGHEFIKGSTGFRGIEFKPKRSGNSFRPVRVGYKGATLEHYIRAAIEGVNGMMPYVQERRR
jgi:hypothetical protein